MSHSKLKREDEEKNIHDAPNFSIYAVEIPSSEVVATDDVRGQHPP